MHKVGTSARLHSVTSHYTAIFNYILNPIQTPTALTSHVPHSYNQVTGQVSGTRNVTSNTAD